MKHILIVDDEANIRTVLRGALLSPDCRVTTTPNGSEALELLDSEPIDLLLVDLQMDGMTGLEVIRCAKETYPNLATIILTGYATVDSAIAALRDGVDDYLIKPAKPKAIREAVANALQRRQTIQEKDQLLSRIASDIQQLIHTAPASEPSPEFPYKNKAFTKGGLTLNEATFYVCWYDKPLSLTPTEFRLLHYMARHANIVHSPQELVNAVQGYDCSRQEARELIKPHIYRLRSALEADVSDPRILINVRGIGYMLRLED